MLIGVPNEIKNSEYRVGLLPTSVRELVLRGHQVIVESQAGMGIGYSDADYRSAGAKISDSAQSIFAQCEMVIKVKEPLPQERAMLRPGQILFTFLHLAADLAQTQDLINSGATCIAYETVTNERGSLPLLAPMSEVAGRLSIQAGARCLEKANGGSGILLSGVTGVSPAQVVIIGGGVVGRNAAHIALGMGAKVTILDRSIEVLRALDQQFNSSLGTPLQTLYSSEENLEQQVMNADLVIGSVLIPGASAPKLVTARMIKEMKAGSVLVDVAIDQGGCFATSKPTTHDDPTFIIDDVVHYCVANMPGAVPKTSTQALNNVTLPYVMSIANKGVKAALLEDENLLQGLNVAAGQVTCQRVAQSLGLVYREGKEVLTLI